jgi:hypothetical protein
MFVVIQSHVKINFIMDFYNPSITHLYTFIYCGLFIDAVSNNPHHIASRVG